MTTAIACTVLLALLVFGLGVTVSLVRFRTPTTFAYTVDPRDPLYKLIRAHGNATEYAPNYRIACAHVAPHTVQL